MFIFFIVVKRDSINRTVMFKMSSNKVVAVLTRLHLYVSITYYSTEKVWWS